MQCYAVLAMLQILLVEYISKQQPADFTTLQTTLGNDLTAQTQKTIADSHPNLKAALILGSPEMMYR